MTDNASQINYTCYDTLGRTTRTVANASWMQSTPTPCDAGYVPSGQPDEDVIHKTVYDAKGDAIATIDALNHTARTYYDSVHRPRYAVQNLTGQTVEVTTPPTYNPSFPDQNARQEMRYDSAGRTFETVDNAGMVTRATFDLLDRTVAVAVNYVNGGPTDNQTNLTTGTTYDIRGNATRQTDANGLVTAFEYDALNRLTAVVENYLPGWTPTADINVRTEYTYDSHGNRLSLKDGNGHVSTFTYDKLDRVKTESAAPTVSRLKGEYFNNTTLTGTPVLTRREAPINFD